MMANDCRDLSEVFDFRQYAFADLRVLLHDAALGECQRTRLLKKARRQPDLPDVMYETADVRELLLLFRQAQPPSNVTGVDGDGG